METKNQIRKTRDVYELITEKVIVQLKKGIIPWRKTWTGAGIPKNLVTGKPFYGINLLLLSSMAYEQNYFLTFWQAKELGGKVRKGEKGIPLIYWKKKETEIPGTLETSTRWITQCFLVYNISQCEGISRTIPPIQWPGNPIEESEKILNSMSKLPIIKETSEDPYYNPVEDVVYIPKRERYQFPNDYYHVLFKLLVHSTGHQTRLSRYEILNDAETGSQKYAIEQLTGELGAFMLLSETGFSSQPGYSVPYIQTWLYNLRCDKKVLVNAGSRAQKAVDFILQRISSELSVGKKGASL